MKRKLLVMWSAVWYMLTRGMTIWLILISSCIVFGFMCGRAWYLHGSPEQYLRESGIPLSGIAVAVVLGCAHDAAQTGNSEKLKERTERDD